MRYESILVHLDTTRASMRRLDMAARLAVANECRLIALFAGFVPDPAWYGVVQGAAQFVAEEVERRHRLRDEVRCRFEDAVRALPVQAEWRTVESEPVMMALREAREAALIVAGQHDPGDLEGFVAHQFLESLILESGRPVLVVPFTGDFPTVGKRVIVAWNGSREAARALHDAIPLIAGAQATILSAETTPDEIPADATPADHAARALMRHGVAVNIEHAVGGSDVATGELLLSRAADFNADLIVMGAYGHGRLRELVLGGVTRTLLASMTVPVLMSH
jgi:nucleotide-binding universal stress UspA family protein